MRKAGSNENLSGKPKVHSEKHDVLYSKARYVLNQRHIKRPWFNLNPFLEKTDESIDLENFLPGESKYIQPLESLVLSESFHSDHPLDTREISIDAFFQYLFSDEWDKACSVRILEGQLLDQLLLGLYRLENKGIAVRHTTNAFARNHRPRTGCYKLTNKESSGYVDETLLLEFAHFGRLTKEKPNLTTLNTFEYLEREQDDYPETDEPQSEAETLCGLPVVPEMAGKRRDREEKEDEEEGEQHSQQQQQQRESQLQISQKNMQHLLSVLAHLYLRNSTNRQPFSPNLPENKPNWGRQGSLMSKHVCAMGFLKAMQSGSRRQSISIPSSSQENKTPIPTPVSKPLIKTGLSPLSESRRHTITEHSQLPVHRRQSFTVPRSFDGAQVSFKSIQQKRSENTGPQRSDENGCLQKPRKRFQSMFYTLDFDDELTSEAGDIDEDREEELPSKEKDVFFGEELYLSDKKREQPYNLRSAKRILQQKKKELREGREEAKRQKEIQAERLRNFNLSKLPKFQMKNSEPQRVHYEMISLPNEVPTLEEFVQFLKHDEYYDLRYRNKVRQKSKKMAQRYYQSKGKHRSSIMYGLADIPDDMKHFSTYRRSSGKSVSSVREKKDSIDMKIKGNLALMPALQESDRHRQKTLQLPGINQSRPVLSIEEGGQEVLGVTDSEPCKDHYIKGMKHSFVDISSAVGTVTPKSQLFPKITMCEHEIESSDTDSEESASDCDSLDDTFDTKKLNRKYSIERLGKKRRSKVKKKAGFIEVLAKYYNMQNALRVFRKGSAGKESKKAGLRASQLGMISQSAKQKADQMVIGKLRKFNFLNVKDKKKINANNVSQGDFSSPNLAKFHEQLNEALDRFVVRQEIVVSDLTTFYTATTSVTFTKISCFQHKHKSCREIFFNRRLF